jgi:hypothetical protein
MRSIVISVFVAVGMLLSYWHGQDRAYSGEISAAVRGAVSGAITGAFAILFVDGFHLLGMLGAALAAWVFGLVPAWFGARSMRA